MRAFIAIELPEEIKSILSNIQSDLKQAGGDVKWIQPKNIHLTLKFLGEIKQETTNKICSILNEVAQRNTAFSLCLSKLGAFPKPQYPRVIWISVANDQAVIKIAQDLEKELLKIGLPTESRAFSAHITLGRLRSSLNRKSLIEKLESLNKDTSFGSTEFKVLCLTLFKSTLTPQGPIYEVILSSALKPA